MYGSSVGLALQALKPSVVLNMVCFTAQTATDFIAIMRGLTKRVVVISSADVYLAFGRLHRSEAGPLQPMPLTEMSALRTTGRSQGPEYDKISVEKIVIGNPDLPDTILRFPTVYGPNIRCIVCMNI